ncbi:MAG: AEC family transporter [Lawsonibacter sp.]|jgi:predicted permease|nr:AEC family transporter [Lawsonibacter sp.]
MDIAVLFSNLVGLFLLIGVGFFAVRMNVLPIQAAKPMSALLMKITVPATVVSSMLRPFDPAFLRLGLSILAVGTVLFALFAALSLGLAPLCRVPRGRRGMWCCCATFCNNSFMGFPVALAVLGEEGLALTVILAIPFNLMAYSIGARMVCMDADGAGAAPAASWKRALFSTINLATLVGTVLYITQLPVPEAVQTPLRHLSNVTTPLSMIITGMNLSQGSLADVVRDRDAFTASAMRLLLFPLIAWGVMRCIPGLDGLVMGAALLNMSMPAPAAATLMGEEYGGNVQIGSRIIFLSSLLCVATIPLISLLL